MWQCKYCRERFLEQDVNHVCMTDQLSHHFKGRKAVLEPLFRVFLQKLHKLGEVKVGSDTNSIIVKSETPFAVITVALDHLEVFISLPATAPISPQLSSATRLHVPNMTHFFTLKSVKDITPDIMRSLMWAKEAHQTDQKASM